MTATKLTMAEQFMRITDDGRFDLIDGDVRLASPTQNWHGVVSGRLSGALYRNVEEHGGESPLMGTGGECRTRLHQGACVFLALGGRGPTRRNPETGSQAWRPVPVSERKTPNPAGWRLIHACVFKDSKWGDHEPAVFPCPCLRLVAGLCADAGPADAGCVRAEPAAFRAAGAGSISER